MTKRASIAILVLSVLLAMSLGFLAFLAFLGGESLLWTSYLQAPNEIYIMESGILRNAQQFRAGADLSLTYDFAHPDYERLLTQYALRETAGEGSVFTQAKNLMDEYAPRLTHRSDYDNHVPMNALTLLDYALDNRQQGINCRAKAQILNEMCLALGIYARKVWILPNSAYDNDCHVVNEVWDPDAQKWIMLDITTNTYWVDEAGTPLSVLEIRHRLAANEFCTPIGAGETLREPEAMLDRHYDTFLYIAKNMVWMQYCSTYTVGEAQEKYSLLPVNLAMDSANLIAEDAVKAAPLGGE